MKLDMKLQSDRQLIEVAVNIFKKCLTDDNSRNILTIEEKQDDAVNELFSSLLPVILIKSFADKNAEKETMCWKNCKESDVHIRNDSANNFIILASTLTSLISSLHRLKQTNWWNHNSFYLVIERSGKNRCITARPFLESLWAFNILSALYLCRDADDHVKLYTFNPYAQNRAPKFWSVLDTYNRQWTLLQHTLTSPADENSMACKNLKFDKTRNLNKHPIKIAAYVHTNLLTYDSKETGVDRFGGVNADIFKTICKHINATVRAKFYRKMGSVDRHGHFHSFLKDLNFGKVDFAMNMNIMRRLWKRQTYPHEMSGFCIVSLKDTVTFLEKVRLVFVIEIWFTLCLTMTVAIFVLKFTLNQPLTSSFLHCLQMLLSNFVLCKVPKSPLARIALLMTIFTCAIMSGLIQIRLSAINLVPNTSPTVITFDDLVSSKLPVYGTIRYNELFDRTELSERYELLEYPKCMARLYRGERVACIPGCIEAKFKAYESETFYISQRELRTFYMVFSVRQDWPLLERFDLLLRRITEAGIVKLFRAREERFYKKPTIVTQAQVMTLANLTFCFVLLAMGFGLASFGFIGEIGLFYFARRLGLKSTLSLRVVKPIIRRGTDWIDKSMKKRK